MRKSALLLAALLAVTVPSVADAAKKGKKAKKPAPVAQTNPNDAGARLAAESARQWIVPFQSLMAPQPAAAPKKAKKGKKAKKAATKNDKKK
jgi:hypothetical protein